jgi:hypothetical protein
MKKKKIYIAGKVTGEPIAECTIKFGTAQKQIEALGFEAINPLELVGDFRTPWDAAMRICIKALMDCDAVVLLPDWANSKGAMFEHEIAQTLEMPIFNVSKGGLAVMKSNSTSWNS